MASLGESIECFWCASPRAATRRRKHRLCGTCLRIADKQRQLAKIVDGAASTSGGFLSNAAYDLAYYKERESQQRGLGDRHRSLVAHPDGLGLEHLVREVALRAGCPRRRNVLYGCANTFTHDFSEDQRRILVSVFASILREGDQTEPQRWARVHAANACMGLDRRTDLPYGYMNQAEASTPRP